MLFWPLCSYSLLFFFFNVRHALPIIQNKCKIVNMTVYSIAAVFSEVTGKTQYIFLLVQ